MARGAAPLAVSHLRRRPTPPQTARLHCLVLDCSASMLAGGALARAKGVLLGLMEQAYRQRDHVALVCFAGHEVQLRLPPQKAAAWNEDWVAPIAGGGGTPLAAALDQAQQLLQQQATRLGVQGWLWLLSDGRTREQPPRPSAAQQVQVVDFEMGRVRLRRAQALASAWQADYQHAEDWDAGA